LLSAQLPVTLHLLWQHADASKNVARALPKTIDRRFAGERGIIMRQLTDLKIRSLKPAKDGKPYDEKDTQVPGLHVRVMPTGKRTFVLLARFPGSPNPTRRSLGSYGELTLAEARDKANIWRRLIGRGIDPQIQEERDRQAALRQQQTTFGAVAEDFIRDKLPSEKKGGEVAQDIKREFIPRWGNRPIGDITPKEVRDFVKSVKDRGKPYQAHNLLVTIRRLFEWAIDQHVYGIESSPCDRLKPKAIIGQRLSRTRVLDSDELRAFWRAAGGLGYPYGPLYQLLALLGQRRNEVGRARWSEFNLEQKLWTIPAERMKAGATHVVPLPDDALTILRELPRFENGDYLFSTTFGRKPVYGFNRAKHDLDQRMRDELPDRTISPFVIHDIRRTMRTGLSALPIPDLIRELVIGHTKPGLHKVYDQHAYADEKRHALDLWAARLRNIVNPTPANVVKIRTRVQGKP
jgi:integrase